MNKSAGIWPVMLIILLAVNVYEGGSKKAEDWEVVEVDSQLTLVLGSGGNSAIYEGEHEVVVVDPKMMKPAERLRTMVEEKAAGKTITVINTHYHFDHVKGNELYPDARLIAGAYTREEWSRGSGKSGYPDVTVEDTLMLNPGGERIVLRNMGQAHTPNDVVVYFQRRAVLMTGDLVFADRHPVLVKAEGAHTELWQGALERLLDEFSTDTVVPGHGSIADMGAIERMRDYFADIRAALDDKEQLRAIKGRYKGRSSVPFFASFSHTVKTMRKERE